MIYVVGPRDKIAPDVMKVDVTSRASSIFSPFLNETWSPIHSQNMENAWQYSKVYKQHDDSGKPNADWYLWHKKGLLSKWADRYPMGKGAIPLYTWFQGQALDYIKARKKLYIPLYENMIGTDEHASDIYNLMEIHNKGKDIALWDFDGYNDPGKTFDEILNDPSCKMGHAFVLREVMIRRWGNENKIQSSRGHIHAS